jgi:hypothetical protein
VVVVEEPVRPRGTRCVARARIDILWTPLQFSSYAVRLRLIGRDDGQVLHLLALDKEGVDCSLANLLVGSAVAVHQSGRAIPSIW